MMVGQISGDTKLELSIKCLGQNPGKQEKLKGDSQRKRSLQRTEVEQRALNMSRKIFKHSMVGQQCQE